jgi:hypothetical protein
MLQVWMCINKKLKVIDCVEDPRPPHAKSSKLTTTLGAGQQADVTTASAHVPPNYYCNMVMLPKLQQHWGKTPGFDAVQPAEQGDSHKHHSHNAEHHKHHHDDKNIEEKDGGDVYYYEAGSAAAADKAVAELAAAAQPLMESAADAVQELMEGGDDLLETVAEGAEVGVHSVAASLAAVEQVAAAVAMSVAEAVAAAAAGTAGVAVAPTSIDPMAQTPVLPQQAQHTVGTDEAPVPVAKLAAVAPAVTVVVDKVQQHGVDGPNKHLPLLAAVVVAVVAAAVVAAAVALRAAPFAADAKGSCRGCGYVPPGIVSSPETQKLGEAFPLLAAFNTV